MDSNTDVFFFFLIFLVLGVRKKKSREDHPKRYIGKNEKQENRMGEREIKREINVLLEYLFTIWESHRIDHIRRRRLVDSKAGCVFFWLRFFPTCLVGLWKKKKKFPLFLLSLNQREKKETEKFLFGAENALVLHKHVITIIKKKTKSKSLSLSLFSRNFFGSRGERCYWKE